MTLSSRDQRTGLTGVVVVTVLLMAGRGLPSIRAWNETRETAALRAAAELGSVRPRAGQTGAVFAAAAAQRREFEGAILRAPTPALASARLVRRLTEAAKESRVELRSIQPLERPSKPPFAVLGARLILSGSLETVAFFVATLEGDRMRIVVRDLVMAQPDVNVDAGRVETIRAEIGVEALAMIDPREVP